MDACGGARVLAADDAVIAVAAGAGGAEDVGLLGCAGPQALSTTPPRPMASSRIADRLLTDADICSLIAALLPAVARSRPHRASRCQPHSPQPERTGAEQPQP